MVKRVRSDLELYFDHGIDLATRTVYIGDPNDGDGDIGPKTAADAIKGLHIFTHSYDPEKPINIVLNSSGGNVTDGLAIHDAIVNCTAHVNITVYGQCCSIAMAILQAGDSRYATKNAWLMVHDGEAESGIIQTRDVDVLKEITDKQKWQYYNILAKYSSLSPKDWGEKCRYDYWMSADDAYLLGLIDGVI